MSKLVDVVTLRRELSSQSAYANFQRVNFCSSKCLVWEPAVCCPSLGTGIGKAEISLCGIEWDNRVLDASWHEVSWFQRS